MSDGYDEDLSEEIIRHVDYIKNLTKQMRKGEAIEVIDVIDSDAAPHQYYEGMLPHYRHVIPSRDLQRNHERYTDGTMSTMDFEDALEDHSVNHHDSRHYDNQQEGEMMMQQQQGRDGSGDNYYGQG